MTDEWWPLERRGIKTAVYGLLILTTGVIGILAHPASEWWNIGPFIVGTLMTCSGGIVVGVANSRRVRDALRRLEGRDAA